MNPCESENSGNPEDLCNIARFCNSSRCVVIRVDSQRIAVCLEIKCVRFVYHPERHSLETGARRHAPVSPRVFITFPSKTFPAPGNRVRIERFTTWLASSFFLGSFAPKVFGASRQQRLSHCRGQQRRAPCQQSHRESGNPQLKQSSAGRE